MEMNNQLSVEGLLQVWVNISYRMYYYKEKSAENIQGRRDITNRLRVKGISEITIYGIDDESYTLEYKQHNSRKIKKVFIEK